LVAARHLILDVNVIIDYWLDENSARLTDRLLKVAFNGGSRLWITAASIGTLDYVTRRALKHREMPPEAVTETVPQLMQALFSVVGILTNHGFEQADVYARAIDFEDSQTAAAARSLAGQQVCIVTEDDRFDALGEIPCRSPAEALAWLTGEPVPSGDVAIPFIDLATQQAAQRPQLERNIEIVLRHGQYIMGPEVKQLEDKLAAYVGAKHCITASSGTDTLLIAMMALGISLGDEVITTPFTFVATGEVIALLGATPVFVDIDPKTYNIDPARIEDAITPKTKAIMPVSLYGQCADMDAINTIAEKHRLPVIEDAAQSFGATYKGRKSCALSTIGSTSFFPSKPLGGYGDGGALFTDNDALAKTMREIRVHGQDRRYHHPRIGINGRMDTLQAAILLAKLERFDWEVDQRQKIGASYTAMLRARCPSITTPYIESCNTSVYAQYSIQVQDREAIAKRLNEQGIPTAVHYPVPLNQQPAYQLSCGGEATPVSDQSAKMIMSLPMGPDLSANDQERIVGAVEQALAAGAN
jgi:UDP-2-acetamido-2-deoxy-ribo-hexuluronate aminotransferase